MPHDAREVDLLDWLSKHTSLELSFQGWDEESCWQVHRVNGGRNDREWTLLSEGETPLAALLNARRISDRTTPSPVLQDRLTPTREG